MAFLEAALRLPLAALRLPRSRRRSSCNFRGKDCKDNLQLGCMTPNGSENVVHDLSLHLQLHPQHTLLHLDVKNAFNTQHRFAFLKEVYAHFPALLPLCAQ